MGPCTKKYEKINVLPVKGELGLQKYKETI